MATWARRSISRSSWRRWPGESTRRGMASPLHPPPGNRKQILRNNAPPHIALESGLAFVGCSPHRKRMLQCADGSFNTRPPAQRPPEPALLLPHGARLRQTPPPRQGHLLHPVHLSFALVGRRKKPRSAVASRRPPEQSFVLLQGRN